MRRHALRAPALACYSLPSKPGAPPRDTSGDPMTVRNGREFLSIPGPTTVPDAVLNAMHRPAVDIYSGRLVELTDGLLVDLKKIFRTQGNVYIYASNGHGAWEAAVTNVLSRGDKILVLE